MKATMRCESRRRWSSQRSRRTQEYWKSFLEANGYVGRIVLFNGTKLMPVASNLRSVVAHERRNWQSFRLAPD